jgi:hypothetical protein
VAKECPDGLDARGVALDLGDAVLAGPAPVAVHDDRDVTGNLRVGQEALTVVDDGARAGRGAGLGVRAVRRRRRIGRTGEGRPGH